MKQDIFDQEDMDCGGYDDVCESENLSHTILVESEKWRRRESKIKCRRKSKDEILENVSLA